MAVARQGWGAQTPEVCRAVCSSEGVCSDAERAVKEYSFCSL